MRIILLLAILMPIVGAGTVTLTGTCPSGVLQGNAMGFSLVNNGNEPAYNLVVTPSFAANISVNSSYTLAFLPPNVNARANFNLTTHNQSGTIGSYFAVTYQQSSSTFVAVFPCLVSLKNSTISKLVTGTNASAKNNTATITASIFNSDSKNVTATLLLVLPPVFTYQSGRQFNLTLGPLQKRNVVLTATFPPSNSSYSGAVIATYQRSNIHYSSFSTFSINTSNQVPVVQPKTYKFSDMLPYIIVTIIAFMLILVIRSYLIRRKSHLG